MIQEKTHKEAADINLGYRKTKLGWIPEDWEIDTIENSLKIDNNKRKPISAQVRKTMQGDYPYYGPTKIQDYINEYQYEGEYAIIAEDGDHFLKYRDFPMTQFVSGKFNLNNHAHALQGTNKCLTKWFYWFYNRRSIYSHLTRQGAGRYKLNKTSLAKMKIAYPKIEEQKRIIQILETWDTSIRKLTALISMKELQKKGLMQQLLLGNKRLKGFNKTVELKKLSSFITEVNERNKNGNISRVLSVTNSKGFVNQSEHFDRVVASKDLSNYKIVKKGQFAYNPSRVNVGSLDLLSTIDEGLLSPMYVVFETIEDKLLARFLYYHLNTWWFIGHIPQYVQGSVRDSLAFKGLIEMKFFVPSLEEQKAITEILLKADREIDLLSNKRNQLKEQKKGLMQQLLLGKQRLKV